MTLKRRRSDGRIDGWPTPVYRCQRSGVEEVNRQLASLVTRLRSEGEGVHTSNHGDAWQSRADFLRRDERAVAVLRGWILEASEVLTRIVTAALDDFRPPPAIAEAWAVVHGDGGFHDVHLHPGSVWSGVYYVQSSEEPSGTLELIDPRPLARHLASAREETTAVHTVEPTPGLLVAFPSWLLHRVAPATGSRPRIAVAFNVGYEEQGEGG